MKPHEILGMVEEAAGTRMYETKRVAALKTIDKKQLKVEEINSVLTEEITPTLERLRGEKQHYLKWSKNNADIERIERFVVAADYSNAEEVLTKSAEGVAAMEDQVKKQEETIRSCREEVTAKEAEITELSSKLSDVFEDKHKQVKATEEKKSKELVKATSAWQNSKNGVSTASDDLSAARALLTETKNSVSGKEKEISKDAAQGEKASADAAEAEKEFERLSTEYQNMCAGISSEEDGDGGMTLPDQISKAHNDANDADARAKQAKMKSTHLTKTMKTVEKDMKKEEKSAEQLASKKEKTTARVESIRSKMSQIDFSESEFAALETESINLENTVSNLEETVDTLTAQLQARLAFNYSDPVKGFDRSKVKGLVARLIQLKEPKHATALEVAAGSRLFQVVVEDAIIGKALLNKGRLQKRVTIIPLDKIQSRYIPDEKVRRASSMATQLGTSAAPAIELIGFEEEVRNAMEYVFGAFLIVDSAEAANKICDATKTRTVTLDGDVYDPAGTISGGSKNNLGTVLKRLAELNTASSELDKTRARLTEVAGKVRDLQSMSKKFGKLSDDLEIASAELSAVEKHLSQTKYGMLAEKYNGMKEEVNEANVEFEKMEDEKTTKWKLYHDLKEKEADLTREREARLKEIDVKVKKADKTRKAKAKKARETDSQSQTLLLELESIKTEVAAAQEAVAAAEKAEKEAKDKEADMEMKVGEIKALYDEAKAELDEVEEQVASCNSELKSLSKQKARLTKKAESAELEAKKLSVRVAKFHKEKANAERLISSIMKKYPWIESEKDAFGVVGGDYDFESTDPSGMSTQLKTLKSEQESLAKKINKKVMGMIEKAEGEYTELLRKRKVVENDKKKIQAVIEELDAAKKSELERTWVKVNRDFGSIFSTLLPGTSAKLEPPEGMQAWEGLEVKVAFGDVWKQSLTELSGGQRSLLALSLILSLLLFKPAPMYILDEVDAALDLSHTQNIGNMLKTHFSHSQFIVVSLKEGMFSNANVIFRTKFVDGVSTVNRTIGTGSSAKARALAESDDNKAKAPARKRASRGARGFGKENAISH
eukprot:CAMPEP_0113537252 /NCGR_PEP_ID=MMETSP0015_2-20120614/6726_1 /TAXON_ID=2838 /ORGANISM="Odontella" /LENGTH=1061 /DNA_ID=CAMNT_0000436733 /DNA_START=557 /DNA_END=3742 /DNA_ORIENTATION=- /assembly_acc=CAM_ASM_000160